MRLSTKGRYALRAMVDLATHSEQTPVRRREIADRQGISPHYLEQLFAKLRDAGLIEAVRGPGGGYRLARRAEEITAGEVVRAVEDVLSPVACLLADPDQQCERAPTCPTQRVWRELGERVSQYLDSVTVGELCEDARQLSETE
ncbi:MAG: Rrf2 family transcriptional regulator [Anaerolineae bacterium]|nr:Rrf2 family transcriptional regulator [Anaerolineae bacterium]